MDYDLNTGLLGENVGELGIEQLERPKEFRIAESDDERPTIRVPERLRNGNCDAPFMLALRAQSEVTSGHSIALGSVTFFRSRSNNGQGITSNRLYQLACTQKLWLY